MMRRTRTLNLNDIETELLRKFDDFGLSLDLIDDSGDLVVPDEDVIQSLAIRRGFGTVSRVVNAQVFDQVDGINVRRFASKAESLETGLTFSWGLYGTGTYFVVPGSPVFAKTPEKVYVAKVCDNSNIVGTVDLSRAIGQEAEELRRDEWKLIQTLSQEFCDGDERRFRRELDQNPEFREVRRIFNMYDALLNGPYKDFGWYAVSREFEVIFVSTVNYFIVLNADSLVLLSEEPK